MTLFIIVSALVILFVLGIVRWEQKRKLPSTWKELGQTRGRTRSDPVGTLDIKVTRRDGRVEHHHVPAQKVN